MINACQLLLLTVQCNFCAMRLHATWQAYCTDRCATWRCAACYREHSTWHFIQYATCHVARQALDNILCAINLILWIAIAGLFLWIMLENKFRSATAVRSARCCKYLLFCCFIWQRHSSLAEEETFGPFGGFRPKPVGLTCHICGIHKLRMG